MTLSRTEQVIEEAEANANAWRRRALSAELALRYITTRLQEDRERLRRESERFPDRSWGEYAYLFGVASALVDMHAEWADQQGESVEAETSEPGIAKEERA